MRADEEPAVAGGEVQREQQNCWRIAGTFAAQAGAASRIRYVPNSADRVPLIEVAPVPLSSRLRSA